MGDGLHSGLSAPTRGRRGRYLVLIARGIIPLREDELTKQVGAVNVKALTRIDAAIRMRYEL